MAINKILFKSEYIKKFQFYCVFIYSYVIKRRGPQRSINAIISSTFLIGVVLCSIVCIQFLRDSEFLTNNLLNWQLVIWSLTIWLFMSRFMTIGFKINKKYRCMSTVIMEQVKSIFQTFI